MGNKANQKNRTAGLALAYTEPAIADVKLDDKFDLEIKFEGGVIKHLDLPLLIQSDPIYKDLIYFDLFISYKFTKYGISWDDSIDVSSWWLWENCRTIATQFDGLIGMHDATERWGLNESTIRKAIAANRFVEGIDYKKFGNQYVLTEASVRREYGDPLNEINPDEFDYPDVVIKRYLKSKDILD